ncbi:MAG: TetR/AcrR family transcriptional regulator [Deltaproteobacteria bacterium]|uniref:TetR/AcrR family transcriptional regulator n=1 Tax=Candidatus Zymogenus saltonus TaxID=2844893 RepID=A0A9D8KGZ5_9DELT|nr:TetR/AcrR family transcriptional regulator [Candidatus Zymogenus saltonus]
MPKETFDIISDEKRERIYFAAAKVFARDGFEKANMREIAKIAVVSKGSLYDYFENKEDLYLSVSTHAISESRKNIDSIIDDKKDFFDQLKDIFHQGLKFVTKNREYTQLYANMSSCGMEDFARKLTLKVEKHTSDYYKEALKKGVDDGTIRPDTDIKMAAFIINSLYVILMISMVSEHYRIRLGEYLEIEDNAVEREIENKIDNLVEIIRFSLENWGRKA